tara:strand:+ start:139 stop:759 length:621 start_codon:yes stop_codon:yes gene_type:complete
MKLHQKLYETYNKRDATYCNHLMKLYSLLEIFDKDGHFKARTLQKGDIATWKQKSSPEKLSWNDEKCRKHMALEECRRMLTKKKRGKLVAKYLNMGPWDDPEMEGSNEVAKVFLDQGKVDVTMYENIERVLYALLTTMNYVQSEEYSGASSACDDSDDDQVVEETKESVVVRMNNPATKKEELYRIQKGCCREPPYKRPRKKIRVT